jgi:FtsP/CotA-like multicopper oxidase with cupredoxin domain
MFVGNPKADPSQCQVQTVRQFRGSGAVLPAYAGSIPPGYPGYVPPASYPGFQPLPPGPNTDPVPGPTLRAKLGDIVELALLNQLGGGGSWSTIDRGEKGPGCDQSTAPYPGLDVYPDCFHGSTTGNIHFHGTHTNPGTAGDNVFIEVRPSLRDASGQPVVTEASISGPFGEFFTNCETELNKSVLSQWPRTWNDLPPAWVATQESLLKQYDTDPVIINKLWPVDEAQRKAGAWPQYYIGATPYCFRLPAYTPPGPSQSAHPANHGGMEQTRALQMGQAPGTHWYHAHKHGSTAIDVSNGMTGAFIIEGQYDDELNTFYGTNWTRTQPVLVINQLGVSPNMMRNLGSGSGQQDKGPDFSVNGRFQPMVEMAPGEVQLWRIVNSSGRSGAYFAGFPPGFQWMQLAQDGVQFTDENYQSSLNQPFLMAAGNRVDLLVMAPSPGTYAIQVKHAVAMADLGGKNPAAPVVLLQVLVRADVPAATGNSAKFIDKAPVQPPFLTNITDAEVVTSADPSVVGTIKNPRVITFASTGPTFAQHTINGHKFDGQGDVPIPLTLDTVEEWKIVNATYGPPISHPFHIHLNPFQILEVFDPRATVTTSNNHGVVAKYVTSQDQVVDSATQCVLNLQQQSTWFDCHNNPSNAPGIWWDVFPIPSGLKMTDASGQSANVPGYFRMRSRFVDFPGNYVMHCHILTHEDRGMMSIVELKAANAPATSALFHHH